MTDRPTPLIAGNWKMNGLKASVAELDTLKSGFGSVDPNVEILICPPATMVAGAAQAMAGCAIQIGGQDCHGAVSGAHTGDISAEMLKDAGATYVIVGHSERRTDHGETSETVAAKAAAGQAAGLGVIVCVGETLEERDDGRTVDIVTGQLKGSIPESADPASLVIAYEPVWAIGTGRTPSEEDVALVHAQIRAALEVRFGEAGNMIRILYGGSVKPENAASLLAIDHVNGALVGGASLKASDFGQIISATPKP